MNPSFSNPHQPHDVFQPNGEVHHSPPQQPTSPPPTVTPVQTFEPTLQPTPVIKYLSTHATEFFLMLLAMALAAFSLGAILHSGVDRLTGVDSSYFTDAFSISSASLIVSLPIFALLFLRIKRAEHRNPVLSQDISRHRLVQLTLVVSFLVGLSKLITYFYGLLNHTSSDGGFNIFSFFGAGDTSTTSGWGNFLHMVVTMAIAGGIFTYFWIDHHRRV